MPRLDADARSLRVQIDAEAADVSLDVRIDGHRVWSFRSGARLGIQEHEWPAALRERLGGSARLEVCRSGGEVALASAEVVFSDRPGGPDLLDANGQRLSVNKWGDLAVSIDGRAPGFGERLLDQAHAVLADAREFGVELFLCSGSLLGAMRRGRLLPHDDDVDFGFVAEAEHPADLNLISYRIERELVARGYTVVRHSGAHLQLYFGADEATSTRFYIDIFTGYFRDGEYHQPFAMRGALAEDRILPAAPVVLEGQEFPGPASPEAWLELCYGPGWATPDPSFRFDTPMATRRRFDAWFGSFNAARDRWEAEHRDGAIQHPSEALCRIVEAMGGPVHDVGAGRSGLALTLRERGHEAVAADFALEALSIQRQAGVPVRYLNLNDRRQALEFAIDLAGTGAVVTMIGLVSGLTADARENTALAIRALLRGGSAVMIVETEAEADSTREIVARIRERSPRLHLDGPVLEGHDVVCLREPAMEED